MQRIIAGLNRDLGLKLESTIDLLSYQNLSNFILRHSFPGKHKGQHTIHVFGNLFGSPINVPDNYSTDNDRTRLKLNTTPIIGHIVIGNFRDELLRVREDASPTKIENQTAILDAQACGRLILERADVKVEYQEALDLLDLSSAEISTHLQPDNQIKLVADLNFSL